MNDDDLPVLTQVLRTSGGRDAHPAASAAVAGEAPRPDVGVFMLPPFASTGPESFAPLAEAPADAAAEPRPPADSFRLPQDNEFSPGSSRTGATLGEPAFEAAEPAAARPRDDEATLAVRLREAVLFDLTARIDTELDARIAQAMHAEIETTLGQLQVRLRTHLTDALRDVIGKAVHEELARVAVAPAAADPMAALDPRR